MIKYCVSDILKKLGDTNAIEKSNRLRLKKMGSCQVAIYSEQNEANEKTRQLAKVLELPIISEFSDTWDLLLVVTKEFVALQNPREPKQKPFWIDFENKNLEQRSKGSGKYRELLARAVGLPKPDLKIVDATAGIARESFLLASLGANVFAIERSPILVAMIQDGIQRASHHFEMNALFEQRLKIVCGESQMILAKMTPEEYPEVIYLDPMFPERKKSALVKKEMKLLQVLNGVEEGAEELFEMAHQRARKRVVVKRPIHAPPLQDKPSFVYKGEQTRFDVYAIQ